MTGKIIKGIAGFYYVSVAGSGIYECKAKGIFRKEGKKPLVGDDVRIQVLDEKEKEANLTEILPRRNELFRPAVANVDQAMVIFALERPAPSQSLLDRFLLMLERQHVPAFLCFNKDDLAADGEKERWRKIYRNSGVEVLFCSAEKEDGLEEVREKLRGKTTVVAGPSGVGKSTLVNRMQGDVRMETGEISRKLKRGRHTTRHSQLIPLEEDTFLCDTPGFTSLYMTDMEKEELKEYFPEFFPFAPACRFQGCAHISEPDCGVKAALEEGKISRERYDSYRLFYEELKEQERRRY
jgi:ribosome biogenesis GTPase